MAAAHAILALLALANQPTPRHALRDATHDTRPDPIPHARDARAPPEHQAHSVLANPLLHTVCSSSHRTLHTSETSARTSARHTITSQTVPLARRAEGEPAFMMLVRTPITCLPSIHDAGQRYLSTIHPDKGNTHEPEGRNTMCIALAIITRDERGAPRSDFVHTTDALSTHTTHAGHKETGMHWASRTRRGRSNEGGRATQSQGLTRGCCLASSGTQEAGSSHTER